MGEIRPHPPVLFLLGLFSRYPEALDWGRRRARQLWGPIALSSNRFDFHQTHYYEPSMGAGLKKEFHAFEKLDDPATLVPRKLQTNDWEQEYRNSSSAPETRPLNLDPGYLTEAKLVLASTKDRDHRIYLDRGIYCEGTLFYHRGGWQVRPWTYPDYQTPEYHAFFSECRGYLRRRYRESA